jgi:hypothetical protein
MGHTGVTDLTSPPEGLPPPARTPRVRAGRFPILRGLAAEVAADQFPIFVLTAGYVAAGLFASHALGWPIVTHFRVAVTWGTTLGITVGAVVLAARLLPLAAGAGARALSRRTGRQVTIPQSWLQVDSRRLLRCLVGSVILFCVYGLFIDTFIGFKKALPRVMAFGWDVEFMQLDRVLHFGRHPWEWLQPLLGKPHITGLIDAFYYLWFPIKTFWLAGFLWVRNRQLRTQFYIAYLLAWIVLGTVMAYLFSSAGPCYFQRVTGAEDPYAPLMQYLYTIHATSGMLAVDVQELLWMDYQFQSTPLLMKGISAMPSLHVALPVLYAIAGWRINRTLGKAFSIYAVIILIGSIHLGWHYAIDGYVAALAIPVIWWVSGVVARRYERAIR